MPEHASHRADLCPDQSGPIDLISDASVHVDRGEGAATWCAVNQNDDIQSADKPLEVYDTSYSYREELLGITMGLTIHLLPCQMLRLFDATVTAKQESTRLTNPSLHQVS